tara:strand:+ start:2235 stop:3329 length:1095 start_codon:yes stop_codon:yes gene_type:complete
MKKFLTKFNKNIIFFCPSIEEGGVEKNLINICNGIVDRHKVTLITANKNKYTLFKKKINFISPNTNFFNNRSRILKSIYCCYLLLKNYDKNKNIIISFQSNILAIIISKILNYKVIVRSNQSPHIYAKNIIKRKIMAFFFKKADKIVVNSNDFKKEFKKFFNIKAIIIYNLVEKIGDLKKYSKKNNKENFFSNSKKIINILSIGRLVYQKDQITILKALNLIKNKKKFKFYLIGKGNEYTNLKKFINSNKLNKQIKILGFKTNVYPYYNKADIFVQSSLFEGLPNTLIEALSFGVPIISSNCKTGPKEILNKEKYGKLFKIKDYKMLSKLILKSKKKLKIKYINDKRFDFNKNLKAYENLITSL